MAVYTRVDEKEVAAFLRDYSVGGVLSFKGIAEGVENSNYLLRTEGGLFILTLYEERVEERDLPYFLGLMNDLESGGIRCPRALEREGGGLTGILGGRPAALISFLDGVVYSDPDEKACALLGESLGRMHKMGRGFGGERENPFGLGSWSGLFERSAGFAERLEKGLGDEIREELSSLSGAWPKDLPSGAIHGDLFPDNVLFSEEGPGFIDFSFACTDMLAYDAAICIGAWCFDATGSFVRGRAQALIEAYDRERVLEEEERAFLPVLCRGGALRFFLTRLCDASSGRGRGALVEGKNPLDYLARLRFLRSLEKGAFAAR